MAYGLKYTLSFFSDRGNECRIEILAKDYQGAPIAKKMGVAPVLNIAQGDGCIQGTSLTFAVQADVDGELQEFYTTDNKQFQVLLFRNGAIMWQGYLLPELYSETYVAPPYDVSLTATDQLATLKDIEYSREDEQVLLQSVLEYLLSHTQLSLPLSYHMQLSVGLGRPMLENVYINQSAYNGSNCYDVLNAILLSMNCRIMQLGNQWLVTSATDNSENYYIERNLEVRPHKTLGQMYVADVYPNGTLGLVNSPALKGATLEYNHIFKKSILKNADCESRVGWEYMSHSSDDGRLPGEITSFGKIFKAYCWQLMSKNIQKDASLHLWQDVEMPADDGVIWSLSFKHLFSINAKLLLLAITHWDDRGVQRRLTGEGWVTQWDSANVNSYIQVTGTPKSASLAEYSDIEQYEMSTVQFTLPPSNGTLRIGFINSTANYADPLAFAPIYVTQVYLTLGAVSGSAATTTIEPNATMGQEGVVLAMGDDVDSSNAVNVALNTLRRYDGGAIAGWMIGDRQFSSYFSMMLQEYSRYFGQKKRQLQGTIMGVDVLANIYKETYSNTVYRLVSADYNLLADEANVTLEEVLSNFVQFTEQIFATNNSNSFGSPTSGGSLSGGSSSVDTSQLLRRDEAAETYATKAALADVNKEIADINNDLDALNELLNSDVSGVINTWGEIVDFLDEYNESQDLASILSQMNSDIANRVHYDDFEKLQEAVDANYGAIQTLQGRVDIAEGTINSHTADIAANTKAITAIDNRVDALEALGFVLKDGYIYTEKTIVSKGEVISGRRASGTSTDVGGGGGISSITAQMIVDALGYVPYSSQNPSGYITSSALNGYAKTSDIPSLSGYATQAWVEGKKYLTGIPSEYVTETELSNTLGGYQTKITSSNKLAYSLISGVPTSLPASDVYAWAKAATKPAYTASEVGALSTSGGTIEGGFSALQIKSASDVKLTLNNTDSENKYQFIEFRQNDVRYGYLGTLGNDDLSWSGNIIIHSGNYSSYALPLSGGTVSGLLTISPKNYLGLIIDSPDVNLNQINLKALGELKGIFQYNANFGVGFHHNGKGGIYVDVQEYPRFVDALANVHTLIHSGNIGSQSVHSATRLQDSNGALVYNSGNTFYVGDSIYPIIPTHILGKSISLRYGASASYGLVLKENGNILVGTTTDSAQGEKLQVSGSILCDNIQQYDSKNGYFIGARKVGLGSTDGGALIYSYGDNPISLWTNYTERIKILGNGNVLMGATTDNGYKLDVNGSKVRFGGLIPKDGLAVIPFAVAMTDYANVGWVASIGTQYGGVLLGHRFQGSNNIDRTILGTSGSVALSINPDGGNVLIGTTYDSGDKLRINGAVRATGHIRLERYQGASEYLQLESEGVNINYRAYDTDGWCSHNFYSNDNLLVRIDGYAGKLDINGNLVATGEVISSRRASASDARLKDNITYLEAVDCLNLIKHIRPAEWDWKDGKGHSLGFIAQEVEQMMPYAVTKIKDEVLGQRLNLQYDQFFAPVVGAIQCLDIKVENHETRLKRLEIENVELKNRLSKYETVWQ